MLWYNGSIAEAVTLSKQRKAVFVVFIEGDNNEATEFASVINNAEVANKLSDEDKFLAIKIKSGSVEYTQFAQIYQFVPVPSLFFIGKNGSPLEVVCAKMEPNVLCSRIDKVLVEHVKENDIKSQTQNLLKSEASTSSNIGAGASNSKSAAASSSSNLPVASSSNLPVAFSSNLPVAASSSNVAALNNFEVKVPEELPKHTTPTPAVPDQSDVVCEGGVCVRRPITTQPTAQQNLLEEPSTEQLVQEAAPPERPLSVDEKVERAKELLEIKKREKEIKEKELAKEKEQERRSTGKSVAQLQRWQAEQEYKQLQEERRREKLENSIARNKILQQIAQDRAEHRARGTAPTDTPPAQGEPPTVPVCTPPEACEWARVQLKLPGGRTLAHTFRADHTLAHLQAHVVANSQLKAGSFSLWTAFPSKELQPGSLLELGLVPSAALLVLPRTGTTSVSTPTPFYSLLSFLTTIFTTVVMNPLSSLVGWARGRRSSSPSSPSASPSAPPSPSPPGLRRRTNVHRLSDSPRDGDDTNTWNGNSTQQM